MFKKKKKNENDYSLIELNIRKLFNYYTYKYR